MRKIYSLIQQTWTTPLGFRHWEKWALEIKKNASDLVSVVSLAGETDQSRCSKVLRMGKSEAKPGWGPQECGVSKGKVAGEGDTSAES